MQWRWLIYYALLLPWKEKHEPSSEYYRSMDEAHRTERYSSKKITDVMCTGIAKKRPVVANGTF